MSPMKQKRIQKQKNSFTIQTQFPLIFLIVLTALTATFIFNEVQRPSYKATSQVSLRFKDRTRLVNQLSNYYTESAMIQDHVQKMQTPDVIVSLAQTEDLQNILQKEALSPWQSGDKPVDRILSSLYLSIDPRTLNVSIHSLDQNPEFARAVSNTLPRVYADYLVDHPSEIARSSLDDIQVTVNQLAEKPTTPFEPQKLFNLCVAFAVSLFFAIAFTEIWKRISAHSDNEENHWQNIMELPILGVIPKEK